MSWFAGRPDRIARFRAGDRDALAEIYRHYLGAVAEVLRQGFTVQTTEGRRHVPGLVSSYDVECGCQEVFLRAFCERARDAFDGIRPYANYLYRIARNWRIDEFRRTHAAVALDEVESLPDPEPAAPDALAEHQLQGLIQAFVSQLPERDRLYCQARFQEGLTQSEAAGRNGLSRIQGRRIEWRIKEALLAFLAERGYGGSP